MMGTTVEVMIDGDTSLVPRAFARLRALEQCWSRFIATSELNRLHRRPGEWVLVSDELWSALSWSLRMYAETAGLFDPTIRTALEDWGYDRTFAQIDPHGVAPTRVGCTPGAGGIHLDTDRRHALIESGVCVDLGGVGKGLAADLVAGELIAMGAAGTYVCAGGDIHAAGEPPDEGWPVPLVHPATGRPLAQHILYSGGIVMSSTAFRRWTRGAVEAHHIIDPRTASPAHTDLLAVAVTGASAARCEALAKAAIIAGSAHGRSLLERAAVDAWLIFDGGAVETVGPVGGNEQR